MKRYFITGTDTDCGKTTVTCALLDYLNQNGLQTLGIKPVASGCRLDNTRLISDDARALASHNPSTWKDIDINPWRYLRPVSPHIAADLENQSIDIDELVAYCTHSQFDDLDCLLVEGAGGLMVPLNQTQTWLDFLNQSQLSVIIVIGMKLGCLNHALMTIKILQSVHIPIAGFIANRLDNQMDCFDENLDTLKRMSAIPYLATLGYQSGFEDLSGLSIVLS